VAEPWYQATRWAILPPARVWFSWRFEHLERIPARGPAIVACNHISYLDPVANAYAVIKAGRRPRFLAKTELFGIPIVGHALRGANQIEVRRGTGDRTPLVQAQAALEAGEVVVIYPEGTVTRRDDGLPMEAKTGTVRLSLQSGVPITPMASWGSASVWQKSGRGSIRPRRPIWVEVGEPIDLSARRAELDDYEALKDMTGVVMDGLTALAIDLRDRYPERWADLR
jgi:1-acyl-sn-glycerol-3-phosphate acyltransferase